MGITSSVKPLHYCSIYNMPVLRVYTIISRQICNRKPIGLPDMCKFISTFVFGDSHQKDSGGNDKRLETKMGNSVAGTKVHLK